MSDSVAIHGEQISGRAAAVQRTLVALSAHLNVNEFDIAELLYEAQENNYCHDWGFPSLPEFAEKKLGMKKRRAQYLARVVRVTRAVGLTRKACEHVHTSKLREITRLNPKGSYFNKEKHENEPLDEHIVQLILNADEMTVKQIKAEVARLMGQVGPDARVVRNYSTTQSAWDNVFVPAMERIRRKLGSEQRDDEGQAKEYSDGVVFEMAMAEILSDPNFEEPMELPEEIAGLVAEPEVPTENGVEKPTSLPQEKI